MGTSQSDRALLKADIWERRNSFLSDQQKGLPCPPPQSTYPSDARLIDLPDAATFSVGKMPFLEAIGRRCSHRRFSDQPLALEELAFLLWSTQGVHDVVRGGLVVLRTVPSAGARHAFETYLIVNLVSGLEPGLYRYLSLQHKLCFLYSDPQLADRVSDGSYGQRFVGAAPVVFVWTAVPYRMEWRYGALSPKLIALDAGHVCENLYLAAESIGAGACAIAAYHQSAMDSILGVDGEEEFTVYMAPVGKVAQER
jgi:SagB-type dehydrogenase family enzyme